MQSNARVVAHNPIEGEYDMMPHKRSAESWRRSQATNGRAAERRRRERDAPLLREEVPHLLSLFIEIKESGQGSGLPDATHIRRFVLATAPALFLFACGEPACEGGGHDISPEVTVALRSRQPELLGSSRCAGMVNEAACVREVHFVMKATFDTDPRVRSNAAHAER